MDKTDYLYIRIDPAVEEEANSILAEMGITAPDAFSRYYRQIIRLRELQFEVLIPNEETIEALEEFKRGEGVTMTLEEFQEYMKNV